jgi:signal transduction histidine kinase
MRAVQRMNRLIGDLLDVVRMETGRLTLDHHACEVNRLLSQAAETFYARAQGECIALDVVEGPDVMIEADEARVLQVIENLVDNALKFTPEGGRIIVSSTVHGEHVHIAVSDTGPGIPEVQLARLFDRFWQARGGDRRGIGIGLTTAKGIAEAHGGRLWVESIVGHGSTFVCALPMRAAAL